MLKKHCPKDLFFWNNENTTTFFKKEESMTVFLEKLKTKNIGVKVSFTRADNEFEGVAIPLKSLERIGYQPLSIGNMIISLHRGYSATNCHSEYGIVI